MASADTVEFNEAHVPHDNAIQAFNEVLHTIKSAILQSRHDWDKHEPRMWSRAHGLSDPQLTHFDLQKDLVQVRAGLTSYGTILLGKLRIPAVDDSEGEGFIHIRVHDPPNRGTQDVIFHSIFTDEGNRNSDGQPTTWRAIQTRDTPLLFFDQ